MAKKPKIKVMTTMEAWLATLSPRELEKFELDYMKLLVSEIRCAIKQEDKQSIKNLAGALIKSANKIKGKPQKPYPTSP